MKKITAMTVFEMPLNGISLALSSSTISLQASLFSGMLLSDRNLSGRRFYYYSDFQGISSLYLEKLYQSNFTAAKSNKGLLRLFCQR